MINVKNYFKPKSKLLLRLSLALRGCIGTLAVSAYVQQDARLAFWFLVAGAVVDLIITLLPPDTKPGAAQVLFMVVGCSLFTMMGCRSVHPIVGSVSKDTTYTTYKTVEHQVKGAKVMQIINIDSLLKEAQQQRIRWLNDSVIAFKTGKAPLVYKPEVKYVNDPNSKAQLSYWVDTQGKLQLGCESKDQTIELLVAENNHLRNEVKTVYQEVYKTPWYNYIILILLLAAFILTQIKK